MNEPEMSLLLRKPTLGVPHAGNKRIEPGSIDFQIIREWVRSGAKPPKKDDVEVEFALKSKANPIGVAEYQLQTRLPAEFKGRLPTARQLADVVRDALPPEK